LNTHTKTRGSVDSAVVTSKYGSQFQKQHNVLFFILIQVQLNITVQQLAFLFYIEEFPISNGL